MDYYIGKYKLDKMQIDIVYEDNKNIVVVAGAGSGKTLTILGKIKHLIYDLNLNTEEILCISFTKEAALSLKYKIKNELNLDVDVFTFHKLSLEILGNSNYSFNISQSDSIDLILNKFFSVDIYNNKKLLKIVCSYFNIYIGEYDKFYNNNYKYIKNLEMLIKTFILLFKTNNYKSSDFSLFYKKIKSIFNIKNYKKEKILLIITFNIYTIYEKYLYENNLIDFDDMITLSTKHVNNNGFYKNIKYIIIDEYQDTSLIRFNLIKEIINKTGAKLMVVGDDFQSIYKFSGCDLSLFLNFCKLINNSCVKKIENTYRNSIELINIAGDFVMKNKRQIKKNLHSDIHLNKPIKVKCFNNKCEFTDFISYLYKTYKKNILILGRNNKDIYDYIDSNWKINGSKLINNSFTDINIRYLTVHKSKGLEDEIVVIINLYDDMMGFPSKIKNDRILRLVTLEDDKYLYAEERRLFYVALTRTKSYVFLFCPMKKTSLFVLELLFRYKNKIDIIK